MPSFAGYHFHPSLALPVPRRTTAAVPANLESAAPAVWVALHETGGDPPYAVAAVTADPAEGEGLTEPGQGIIEAVAMPEPLRLTIAAFVAEHHVERVFERRKRDRADPEALARHEPQFRKRR